MVSGLKRRRVLLARLTAPANFGSGGLEDVQFVVLVLGSSADVSRRSRANKRAQIQKKTKTSLETARTISTLFANATTRNRLLAVKSGAEARKELRKAAKNFADPPPPRATARKGSLHTNANVSERVCARARA